MSNRPVVCLLLAAAFASGCANHTQSVAPRPQRGLTTPPPIQANATPAQPVAAIGNRLVTWPELAPQMAEAIGSVILEEHALGLALKDECLKRAITIGEPQVLAERRLLGELLARSVDVDESEAETLIAEVRRSRGLGDVRFRTLLERNAALRALVRENAFNTQVVISQEDLNTAYDLKHGPRTQAQLILVQTAQDADAASARLKAGEDFSTVARQLSLDPSRDAGGSLTPFSLADTNYPVGVRSALHTLPVGQTSNPISVTWNGGTGFAIIRNNGTTASPHGAPDRTAVAPTLEREVRAVRERAQMERVANEILRGIQISPMDKSLGWSWNLRSTRPQ